VVGAAATFLHPNFMNFLKWNHRKVQQMSPGELYMFIVGRVLAALGLGILFMEFFPRIAVDLAWPALILGMVLLVVASRGLFRKSGSP
jgi:hypothetical protein